MKKTIIIGTSHFVSLASAVDYFADYSDPMLKRFVDRHTTQRDGCTEWRDSKKYIEYQNRSETVLVNVQRKLAEGEIHIGKPSLKSNQTCWVEDGRYIIAS